MCGIAGIYCFNESGKSWIPHLQQATDALKRRGPDAGKLFIKDSIGLGHRRLSIIDTSANANQPLFSDDHRYSIIFNGEIFNYRELKEALLSKGEKFNTQSDTEVVLKLFIREGKSFLNKLNGFFAFAIADLSNNSVFIARDRYGIKPMLYYQDEDKFLFASEMKALIKFPFQRIINTTALVQYFQLNYIVAPQSIFKGVKKLMPGHCITINNNHVQIEEWYHIPFHEQETFSGSYESAQEKLVDLLEASVKRRLISDVPLGSFLSGGIDSSAIVALASRHSKNLSTFSIGFKDQPMFDETNYALLVAKKFNTNHEVFSLSNDDMFNHLNNVFEYIDEPFADSSALPVYILSKETRSKVTVALSGDGADEMFGGYLKHTGEYRIRNSGIKENFIAALHPLWKVLPKSRSSFTGNLIRQFSKFSEGKKLPVQQRYWRFASLFSLHHVIDLLHPSIIIDMPEIENEKQNILKHITTNGDMNDVLLADMNLVLPNDMLTKVDLMSMANSLEVRCPFLDFEVVTFAFSLPADFKIKGAQRKRIVQDAFKKILPEELYQRPKRGFEVPLLQWFQTGLRSMIEEDLLNDDFIESQKIFNPIAIKQLKQKLFSVNPEDVHAQIWALLVFQYWWKKNLSE